MSSVVRFADFELHAAQRQLLQHGHPVQLGGRALDLLVLLVDQRHRTVGKPELIDHCWPDQAVEPNNLAVQIWALRRLLGPQAIATVPGRGYRFVLPVRGAAMEAAGAAAQTGLAHNAPPLFGRDDDLDRLLGLMPTARLVTLTGPGGIGKTRLAAAAARHAGVSRWVDLASIDASARVTAGVAEALGLTVGTGPGMLARVVDALQRQATWLVLDNCEHVSEGVCALLQVVLDRAPQVRVLATSRSALRLDAEQVFRLDGLACPSDSAPLDEAAACGAVALFAARARAADQRFMLDEANLPAVVGLCRLLEGMPLALEMAAARLPGVGVAALTTVLAHDLSRLGRASRDRPGRQQTIEAMVGWSLGLLDGLAQKVFQRASVFAQSFDEAAITAVAADETLPTHEVVPAVLRLAECSLISPQPAATPRWRLHPTARAVAARQLQSAGQADATRRRLALHLCQAYEAHYPWWLPLPDAEMQAATAHLLPNLRPVLDDLSAQPDGAPCLRRLLASAIPDWMCRDAATYADAAARIAPMVHGDDRDLPPPLQARWHLAVAFAVSLLSPDRQRHLLLAVELFCQAGDDASACVAAIELLEFHRRAGQIDEARQWASRAQAMLQRAALPRLHGLLRMATGRLAQRLGDAAAAQNDLALAAAAFEQGGAANDALRARRSLGEAQWAVCALAEAQRTLQSVIHDAQRARFLEDDIVMMAWFNLAGVLMELSQLDAARQALVQAEAAARLAGPRFVAASSPSLALCLPLWSAWLALQGQAADAGLLRACEAACRARANSLQSTGMARLSTLRDARLAALAAGPLAIDEPAPDLALAALVMARAAAGGTSPA